MSQDNSRTGETIKEAGQGFENRFRVSAEDGGGSLAAGTYAGGWGRARAAGKPLVGKASSAKFSCFAAPWPPLCAYPAGEVRTPGGPLGPKLKVGDRHHM